MTAQLTSHFEDFVQQLFKICGSTRPTLLKEMESHDFVVFHCLNEQSLQPDPSYAGKGVLRELRYSKGLFILHKRISTYCRIASENGLASKLCAKISGRNPKISAAHLVFFCFAFSGVKFAHISTEIQGGG